MKYHLTTFRLAFLVSFLGVFSYVHAGITSSKMSTDVLPLQELKNAIAEQDVPTINNIIADKHNVVVVPFLEEYSRAGHAWACYFLFKRLAGTSFNNGDPSTIVNGLVLVISFEILTKMAECTVKEERQDELLSVWNDIFINKVNQYFYSIVCLGSTIKEILESNPKLYNEALGKVKELFTETIEDYCEDIPFAYWVSTVSWAHNFSSGIVWEKPSAGQKTLFIDNLYEMASTDQEKQAQKKVIIQSRVQVYENVIAAYQRIVDNLNG